MKRRAFLLFLVMVGGVELTVAQGRLEKVLSGQGKVIDLTHKLSPKMPYWPGPQYKPFEFQTIATMERDGVFSGAFTMAEHMGTHVDAPNHFTAGQVPVDQLTVEQLICHAVVIDARDRAAKDPDYRLTVADIQQWEKKHGPIRARSLVFLYTGWDARWSDVQAYRNRDEKEVMHFPGFSTEAAEFLVKRQVAGIGIDTLSVDYGPSKDFRVHHITHGAGKYHIENAANLGQLPPRGAIIIVGVIPIEGGSGGPARVMAILP